MRNTRISGGHGKGVRDWGVVCLIDELDVPSHDGGHDMTTFGVARSFAGLYPFFLYSRMVGIVGVELLRHHALECVADERLLVNHVIYAIPQR
jgi:hypothetical protein